MARADLRATSMWNVYSGDLAEHNSTDDMVLLFSHPDEYFDIIIVGRAGLGKSTLGNKVLQAHDDSFQFSTTFVNGSGVVRATHAAEDHFTGFLTSEHFTDRERRRCSVTEECQLVANEASKIRVLDTPGFYSTGKENGVTSYEANLQIFRSIVREQADPNNKIAVKRFVYFLPDRGVPEKINGALQDELKVMYHFFGTAVFNHMVIVATQHPKYQSIKFTVDDEEAASDAIHQAIAAATDGAFFDCPPVPVIYIGLNDNHNAVRWKIEQAQVLSKDECFKPKFRENVCSRCSGEVRYTTSPSGEATPIGILKADTFVEYEKSVCHPCFVPKYSKAEKIVGGIGHIATIGIPYIISTALSTKTWPGFTNKEEICPSCLCSPGSKGCHKVGEIVEIQGKSVRVNHTNEL